MVNHSALISACEKCGEWEKNMEVVVLDTVVFSAVISACEKGGAWKQALQLVGEMTRK